MLVLLLMVVGVALFTMWWFQTELVTLRRLRLTPMTLLEHPERHGLPNARNIVYRHLMTAWHLSPPSAPDQPIEQATLLFVYVHGSGATRGQSRRVLFYRKLQRLFPDAHVLVPELPGYGDRAHCAPGENASEHAVRFAMTWARDNVHADCRIVLWGHSLGTYAATAAAAPPVPVGRIALPHRPPDLLVLEAPFTRLAEVPAAWSGHLFSPKVDDQWPPAMFVCRWIVRLLDAVLVEAYDTRRQLWRLDRETPVVIVHGRDDWLVPVTLGHRLANGHPSVWDEELPFASHNDCIDCADEIKLAVNRALDPDEYIN